MKSVSRVINREPNVSEKLRSAVQKAIDSLGYVPDFAARSLAGGRSFTIGLLFDDYGNSSMPSYYPKVQSGAYRACRKSGYHLLVETLPARSVDFPNLLSESLTTMRVDGFILPPPLADNVRAMDVLEANGIPYARIAPSEDLERAPYVAINDEAAARDMANYLWEMGHRRIGFVAGREDHPAARVRKNGFFNALAEKGCTVAAEALANFQFDLGIEAAKQLMQANPPPTAIFAANDDSAAGVLTGLAQLGLKVPDDVSVAGFDDSWIALSVWPYLTTIHQPIAEMAEKATQMLIERNGDVSGNAGVMLDYHLVERGSTAPPKVT
jgi:LacI family transcriptional regulator